MSWTYVPVWRSARILRTFSAAEIAATAQISLRTAQERLRELVQSGHIQAGPSERRTRGRQSAPERYALVRERPRPWGLPEDLPVEPIAQPVTNRAVRAAVEDALWCRITNLGEFGRADIEAVLVELGMAGSHRGSRYLRQLVHAGIVEKVDGGQAQHGVVARYRVLRPQAETPRFGRSRR